MANLTDLPDEFNRVSVFIIIGVLTCSGQCFGTETKLEKIESKSNRTRDNMRKAYRDIDKKGCEMTEGKIQCLGQRITNTAKNFSDRANSKAKEIKNKND